MIMPASRRGGGTHTHTRTYSHMRVNRFAFATRACERGAASPTLRRLPCPEQPRELPYSSQPRTQRGRRSPHLDYTSGDRWPSCLIRFHLHLLNRWTPGNSSDSPNATMFLKLSTAPRCSSGDTSAQAGGRSRWRRRTRPERAAKGVCQGVRGGGHGGSGYKNQQHRGIATWRRGIASKSRSTIATPQHEAVGRGAAASMSSADILLLF